MQPCNPPCVSRLPRIQTQVLRVRSSSCAMPSYTLEVKVKISLLVHHDCIKTLYKAYITQVYGKEIKSVRSGLLEHTLCKFSCWVFWCFVFFCFFFFNFFFLYQTIHANLINLAKEDIFCFLHGSNAITVYAFTATLPPAVMKPC